MPGGLGWHGDGGGMALEAGLERSVDFVVEGRLLSTPGMIGMIEGNAAALAFENLDEGRATVGFEVCIKHVAAAAEGQTCTTHAKLREVADGRKLRFDVEVKEGERTVGVGPHERRVIEVG